MTAYSHADLAAALESLSDSSLAATEYEVARAVVIAATLAGRTVATAESLTAGLIASTLASVPGASNVLRGGIVAYAPELKVSLLGVQQSLIDRGGVIQTPVAQAMAEGALRATGSDYALACTGVAGPDEQEGHPVGEVHVALAGPGSMRTHTLTLHGTRDDIRHGTVLVVLGMLLDALLPLVDITGN
jgi:nicotinamide-nucleotide amidase